MTLKWRWVARCLASQVLLGTLVLPDAGRLQPAAPAHAGTDESITVYGNRFHPAPVPVPDPRFDPAGSGNNLQDVNTGAAVGRFGQAYLDSMPQGATPIAPSLQGGNWGRGFSGGISR